MRALSVVHDSTGRSLVREFYSMRFLCRHPTPSTQLCEIDQYGYTQFYAAVARKEMKCIPIIEIKYLEERLYIFADIAMGILV
jgi:hypothetical protein